MDLMAALRDQAAEVESWLEVALPVPEQTPAPRLVEAMRYSLMAGGKRLRPVLCAWTCEAGGHRLDEGAKRAAVALEMLHTYSLIHDDLPAMDDDDLRRGRPSCHRAFDEATAILAGDALQTEAFSILASLEDAVLARDLARWLGRASGIAGMAAGQQLDLDATGAANGAVSAEPIHRRKTGALIAAALCMGGRVADMDPLSLERVWSAGVELGVAFQIADDVLDQRADPALLGKSTGKDLEQGKRTALGTATPDEALLEARRRAGEATRVLKGEGLGDERLVGLCEYLVERDH